VADELRRAPSGREDRGEPARAGEGPQSVASGWSRILRLVLGWALVGLGIIGLFVPVLQGILLISLGLLMLSRESPTLRRLGGKLADRYPILRRWHDRIQRRRAGEDGAPGEGGCPGEHGEVREEGEPD